MKTVDKSVLEVGDRVTINTTSRMGKETIENCPRYNPWGIDGTVIQTSNPKMPQLPYIVLWDTEYKNSYDRENLTLI